MAFNPRTATWKERVGEFWRWYPQVADRFYDAIERGQCESLTDEVLQFMNATMPDMAWVFGPGEEGGHSFTVSGEGVVPKQLLAENWHSRAEKIPGWTFYASRQPTPVESLAGMAIAITDQESVDVENFLIKTAVDDERQLIDIIAWHPTLEIVPEEHHSQILFLLLDEALGEFGTEMWLGEIKLEPIVPGENVRSLAELPTFIEQVNAYHQWEKLPPLQAYTLYQLPEQGDFPRGDTIAGTTCIPNVIFDFLEAGGRLPENPLEGTGAQFAYLAIDSAVFPQGKQVDVRANIEEALDDALEEHLGGRTLGGAGGVNETYIDLLLVDGEGSRRIVEQTLDQLQLGSRSRICSFA